MKDIPKSQNKAQVAVEHQVAVRQTLFSRQNR
jgi:hypothetical protein